jgi:hypothetical protein
MNDDSIVSVTIRSNDPIARAFVSGFDTSGNKVQKSGMYTHGNWSWHRSHE